MEAKSNRVTSILFAGMLIGVLAILLVRTAVAQAISLHKCSPGTGNFLQGVATISPSDIWAVGYYQSSNMTAQTLTEHWNGTNWSIVNSPNVGTNSNYLYAAAAISTNDVWAVGFYFDSSLLKDQTLIEHWDGTQWSIVPSPNPGKDFLLTLYGVTAISANDIWAVGFFNDAFGHILQTFTLHWDGSQWSIIPSPDTGTGDNVLQSVSAVSTNDVWAVGEYRTGSFENQTLIEHWDGTQWSIVSSPNGKQYESVLNGVAVVATNDVWAVGSTSTGNGQPTQTLIEHWDGTQWNLVKSPNKASFDELYGVAAVSATDVWAVGDQASAYNQPTQTLIEHWDGTNWHIYKSPNVGKTGDYNTLLGVAALSASDIMAVGFFSQHSSKTLSEFWDGVNWHPHKGANQPNCGS